MRFYVTKKSALEDFKAILRRRDLWILGIMLGVGIATFNNLATWLEPVLGSVQLGEFAGRVSALSIILGLIGVMVIPSRVTKRNLRAIYLRSIALLNAVFFTTLAFVINKLLVFTLIGASGFLTLPAYPVIMDWIGKFCEREIQGTAAGFVGLTSRVFPVVLTLGAMRFISQARLYFTYIAMPVLMALILTLLLPNDHRLAPPQSA